MIIDTINRVISSTGTLPPVLLDLTNDTVRERNLEREQTAHNAEGYQITGQMAIEDAEAWAVGQRNGVDVDPTDITYNNNSKYYSTVSGSIMRMAGEQAQSAATNAQYAYESAISAGESAITSGSCMRVAGESAESAEEAAVISGSYMRMAGESAEDAEAWAVGERGGDPVGIEDETYHNNSKYWSERAQEAATGIVPCGTCLFANLPSLADSNTGDMWNIEDDFITTSDFREGAGIPIDAGSNVYKTVDNKWDVMSTNAVTGIKGNAEQNYRKGNVNLTPANLGIDIPVPINQGGTGGTTAAKAKENLGLGTEAQNFRINQSSVADGIANIYIKCINTNNTELNGKNTYIRLLNDGLLFKNNTDNVDKWQLNVPVKINQGGTGLTAAPTLRVNLGATGTASIFQASPRPGVQGVLPIDYGGTGASTRLAAAKALTNENVGTDAGYFVTLTGSWDKFGYSSIANAKAVLGLGDAAYLAVPIAANKGGTGATTHASNSILAGNGTSALKHISTASGAFYATSANGAAKFGPLPVAQGGTGQTKVHNFIVTTVEDFGAADNLYTIESGSSINLGRTVSKAAGWEAIGVMGVTGFNGTGGTGQSLLVPSTFYLDTVNSSAGTANLGFTVANFKSYSLKLWFRVKILWLRYS